MSYLFRKLGESEAFDPNILHAGIPFTQQAFYGNWQKQLGRSVERYVAEYNDTVVAYFQVIVYSLIHGKNYLYIPYGPVCTDTSAEFLTRFKVEIERIAQEHNAVFARLDITPAVSADALQPYFRSAPLYTYHSAYVQPRFEWFLDLKQTEDDIMKAMHEKTRYSVRLADRKGIISEIITNNFETYFEPFYTLMAETAQRNGFHLHDKAYYQLIFADLPKLTGSYLSVASFEGKILAIDLVIISGGIANYVFGGSSTEERNRMPTYAAQWKAIVQAKSIGCVSYNFGGVAPVGNMYKGWEGLTIFKQKFGGYEVKHADFYDVVIQPFWYHMYNLRKLVKKITGK